MSLHLQCSARACAHADHARWHRSTSFQALSSQSTTVERLHWQPVVCSLLKFTWIQNQRPGLDASVYCFVSSRLQLLAHVSAGILICCVLWRLHGGGVAAHVHQHIWHPKACHLRTWMVWNGKLMKEDKTTRSSALAVNTAAVSKQNILESNRQISMPLATASDKVEAVVAYCRQPASSYGNADCASTKNINMYLSCRHIPLHACEGPSCRLTHHSPLMHQPPQPAPPPLPERYQQTPGCLAAVSRWQWPCTGTAS